MRVWKLEACRYEDGIGSRWGYALAETKEDALELATTTSGLPFIWVHEKHPNMLWPGVAGQTVSWSS